MRYKVVAPDAARLRRALELLEGEDRVRLVSERRLFLTAEDLSPELRRELERLDLQVSEDFQYDLEADPPG